MGLFSGYFESFHNLMPEFEAASFREAYKNFAVEEFKRFHCIGGTILANFPNANVSSDHRAITHVLIRSLLDNYFWLLYIFDGVDSVAVADRFSEYLDAFKLQYSKLYNDPNLPRKNEIETSDPAWRALPRSKDTNSVPAQVKNIYGDRLNYLYFAFRIASFDTHGRAMKTLFTEAFHKDCNFPILRIEEIIGLIANEYLNIWQKIRKS